jgi:hypothetical protein
VNAEYKPAILRNFIVGNWFCSLDHAFSNHDERKTNEMEIGN